MKVQDLRHILNSYGITPDKSKGQHFLLDESIVSEMLEVAEINKEDTIIEIGPGPGVLTSALAQKAGEVITYELDPIMAELIKGQNEPNVEVIVGDVIAQPLPRRGIENYKVVANIPYSITGAIIRKLLASLPAPTSITLLVQKEVAERMAAKPGKMSAMSVAVQFKADAQIVRLVSPSAFWPAPAVDSAVIHLIMLEQPRFDVDEAKFMSLVKHGFAQRRKQLKNTLAAGLHSTSADIEAALLKCDLKSTARAQELSLDQWHDLYVALESTSSQ